MLKRKRKMLEQLTIKNFQKHKLLDIDLDEQITTIVGPSDAGKSAVLRALRWVLTNQPDGTAFIREGAKRASVCVVVDGQEVTRLKGKSNQYRLGDKELVSFGRGKVPDLVARLLQVGEVNFQLQHDSPFWFDLSPGEVSKRLNQIVDLKIVDEALGRASKTVREKAAQKKLLRTQLTESKANKERLKFVDEFKTDAEVLFELQENKDAIDHDVLSIQTSCDKLKRENATHVKMNGLTVLGKKLLKAEQNARRNDLVRRGLADSIKGIKRQKTVARLGTDADIVQKRIIELEQVQAKYAKLLTLIDRIKSNQELRWQKKQLQKRLTKQLPKICPTCSQVVDPMTLLQ